MTAGKIIAIVAVSGLVVAGLYNYFFRDNPVVGEDDDDAGSQM